MPYNTFADAFNLGDITNTAETTLRNRLSSSDRSDYFKFTLTEIRRIYTSLNPVSSRDDHDLRIYDSLFAPLYESVRSGGITETITEVFQPGTYYIRCYPDSSGDYGTYRLTIRSSSTTSQALAAPEEQEIVLGAGTGLTLAETSSGEVIWAPPSGRRRINGRSFVVGGAAAYLRRFKIQKTNTRTYLEFRVSTTDTGDGAAQGPEMLQEWLARDDAIGIRLGATTYDFDGPFSGTDIDDTEPYAWTSGSQTGASTFLQAWVAASAVERAATTLLLRTPRLGDIHLAGTLTAGSPTLSGTLNVAIDLAGTLTAGSPTLSGTLNVAGPRGTEIIWTGNTLFESGDSEKYFPAGGVLLPGSWVEGGGDAYVRKFGIGGADATPVYSGHLRLSDVDSGDGSGAGPNLTNDAEAKLKITVTRGNTSFTFAGPRGPYTNHQDGVEPYVWGFLTVNNPLITDVAAAFLAFWNNTPAGSQVTVGFNYTPPPPPDPSKLSGTLTAGSPTLAGTLKVSGPVHLAGTLTAGAPTLAGALNVSGTPIRLAATAALGFGGRSELSIGDVPLQISDYINPAGWLTDALALVVAGSGAELYSGSTGSVEAGGDLLVDPIGKTINRIRISTNNTTLLFNGSGGDGWNVHFENTGGSYLDGEVVLQTTDGIAVFSVQNPDELDDAGGGFLRFMTQVAADTAILAGVATGTRVIVAFRRPRPAPPVRLAATVEAAFGGRSELKIVEPVPAAPVRLSASAEAGFGGRSELSIAAAVRLSAAALAGFGGRSLLSVGEPPVRLRATSEFGFGGHSELSVRAAGAPASLEDRARQNARSLSGEIEIYALEVFHAALADPARIVNDYGNHIVEGHTFTACGFSAAIPQDKDGEVRRAVLRIDNIGEKLMRWVRLSQGGRGATMRLLVLVSPAPGETESEIVHEVTMDVGVSEVTNEAVSVTLTNEPTIGHPAVSIRHDPEVSPGIF